MQILFYFYVRDLSFGSMGDKNEKKIRKKNSWKTKKYTHIENTFFNYWKFFACKHFSYWKRSHGMPFYFAPSIVCDFLRKGEKSVTETNKMFTSALLKIFPQIFQNIQKKSFRKFPIDNFAECKMQKIPRKFKKIFKNSFRNFAFS